MNPGLINCDLRPIYALSSRLSLESQEELAQHLLEFYLAQDRVSLLLVHIAEREVSSHNNIHLLFREDSFNKTLLTRVLLHEQSLEYLKKLLAPMVKLIETTSKSKDDEATRLKKVLNSVDVFIRTATQEAPFCPPLLRQLLRIVQRTVEDKFGEDPFEPPFALSLLFFHWVCPAVIDPLKYHITKKSSLTHVFMTQVAASKVLKDVATKAKREGQMAVFIEESYPSLYKFYDGVLKSSSETGMSPRSRRNSQAVMKTPSSDQQRIFEFVSSVLK
ncbi:ras GTPase-activating protein 1-like [Planoprotostelium fungivorum]|uniref:Ras GTPase-activating protein 1-like n=1 Tax=Planoprotostelium fungivorum TaxID=1890364 RepID=A0A2P6NN69_9EUKA|nr:ras GTPase-activating protein 1-like [Planoprotostelium fungivorum]